MTWVLPLAFSVGGFVVLRLRRRATGAGRATKPGHSDAVSTFPGA
jgi:hypothetical protein